MAESRTNQGAEVARINEFPAMLKALEKEVARALPRHLTAERMCRIALTEFRKNPKLSKCKPISVFAAVIQAAQLGLEPGLMGHAYLIPFKQKDGTFECQFIPGYGGLIELVRRSGKVKRIEAHVVYEHDAFKYVTGLVTTLEHTPCLDGDPGNLRLVYAVAEFVDGGYHVEVMTKQQVETIRDRSNGYRMAKQYNSPTPWDDQPDEMWRKTAIRRITKQLPKSAELALAIALDDAASKGRQGLTVEDVSAGTWMPADDDVIDVTPNTVGTIAALNEAAKAEKESALPAKICPVEPRAATPKKTPDRDAIAEPTQPMEPVKPTAKAEQVIAAARVEKQEELDV